jgi:hypothetical protein
VGTAQVPQRLRDCVQRDKGALHAALCNYQTLREPKERSFVSTCQHQGFKAGGLSTNGNKTRVYPDNSDALASTAVLLLLLKLPMKKLTTVLSLSTLLLAGCGGGGGSGDPAPSMPTGGSPPPAAGSTIYNECADATKLTFPHSLSSRRVYTMISAGKTAGEVIVEESGSVSTVFNGQSAIQSDTTTTTNLFATATTSASTQAVRDRSYGQIQSSGLAITLGVDSEVQSSGFTSGAVTLPAITTTSYDIYVPGEDTQWLTLKPGQSHTTVTMGTRTNTTIPTAITTTPLNYSTTFTFVARENVTVSGRTFDTCKYSITGGDVSLTMYSWLLVGKGFDVRTDVNSGLPGGDSMQLLLQSATYNGAPL